MSAPVPVAPDAEARRAALAPTRSFIVEAPAGSGKTTLLTQRFLRLLATTEHPESVLAITFTRKATGEMREKIVAALTGAKEGATPRNPADALTLELAREVLTVDAARGWQLLAQPARLKVQTIDSLNHWLAGRLPILSRAGASLAIAARPEELYARAARATIAELESGGALAEALATVLEHLDNEVDRLEPLLASMLASRDRWLRLVLPGAGGTDDAGLRAALEDALHALIAAGLSHAAGQLPVELLARLVALALGAFQRHPAPPAGAGLLARLCATRGAAGLTTQPEALAAWQALATLLLTKGGTLRKVATKNEGFPPEAKADKQAFLALLAELGALEGLEAVVGEIGALPPPAYDEAQWRVLAALHAVLIAAAARLAAVFTAAGVVDFAAVQHSALEALGSPEEPTDLTLELDYRIQHLLVDEFQDTSVAQVALLERLTGGWQPGDGRTLFLVGDPMQSIYAFREADVGLFLKVRRAGLGSVVLEPLTLVANFRSRPAIVEWVNATFARVLPAAEDLARGAVPYCASHAVRAATADSGVRVHVLADAGPAEEATEVAAIVAAERARSPTAKIAVLGQARSSLGAAAHALKARGIAFQGVDLVPLAERPAVRDLIALTRALLHRADRIAWLACLRAPWCGLPLEALAELAMDSPGATLAALLREEPRLERLSPAERARLEGTRAVLEAAEGERGRRSLAATVEAAWLALGGPATLTDAADLDNAESFFAQLESLEAGADLEDPPRLEEALERLYAAPDPAADDSLQLLTVHRAKGLEWDVVVLTGLGRRTRAEEARLLRWLEFARADGGPALVLAPKRAGAAERDALEDWLKSLEKERGELERGRLLYVAATRAKERLYLAGNIRTTEGGPAAGAPPKPDSASLLAKLWPAIGAGVVPRRGAAPAVGAASLSRAPALLRLAEDFRVPAPAAAVTLLTDPPRAAGPTEFEFEWVTPAARHVGTVVHEELERASTHSLAALKDPARVGAWARRLGELGVGPEALERSLERVRRALEGTLADPRGQWLFDPTHTEVESELDLSALRGRQVMALRIDRSFVAATGVRWIVDFKTSLHEGTDLAAFLDQEQVRYREQLEAYAELLGGRDRRHPIRLGLYFPLHAGWREWAAPGRG